MLYPAELRARGPCGMDAIAQSRPGAKEGRGHILQPYAPPADASDSDRSASAIGMNRLSPSAARPRSL